jgi:DNA-binding Lrp family transcriptional regulator
MKDLISRFDALLGPPIAEEIPEGFFSIHQIAKRQNLSAVTLSPRLKKLSDDGKIERRQFRNSNGRVCWFYRVK